MEKHSAPMSSLKKTQTQGMLNTKSSEKLIVVFSQLSDTAKVWWSVYLVPTKERKITA